MILQEYKNIVKKYIDSAIEQVYQQWNSYPDDYGKAVMQSTELSATENTIAFLIAAYGQKMWLLEYGKGELMADESENPFLEQYLSDARLNKARTSRGMKILGRERGVYLDLDNEYHWSSGRFEGMPMTMVHLASIKANKIGWPQKPRFIIRNILFGENNNGLLAEMEKELQEVTLRAVRDAFKNLPRRIKLV